MKASIVTHITTAHPSSDIRIFHKECKSLSKHGIKVNLIATHPKNECIENINIIPLPSFKRRDAQIVFNSCLAFSAALKTQADLFHFHDPELIPVGILLKIFGKKVIYDVHEDTPAQILSKEWITPHIRPSLSFFMKRLEALCSKFFDGIIAATPHITDIFIKRNNNSININNYPILEESIKSKNIDLSIKEEKTICYIGNITKIRGIMELLEAIEGTDIKLHLAGKIPSPDLIKTLKKHKAWKNVVYFGHVDRTELSSILSKSQLGILLFHPVPNHMNCIPNKLFEYMGAGLPIVASDLPFWRKLLKGLDNVYFVDPLNPQAIRTAIKELIADKEKCHSIGIKGIKIINEKYNWGSEEKKLIAFYKKLGIQTA
ncbi:MAG: glycosyltransferase family 4 protein [Alphaproteobacteria bacterium]|nr:glycosyltransferase family 4 protein [Alphaproteobacteria bacterium]